MKSLLLTIIILTFNNCTSDKSSSYESGDDNDLSEGISSVEFNETKSASDQEQYLIAYNRSLSLWPVSYREFTIETSYGKAHIISSGAENAPPMVLLHGMNSSSTMWYPNIGELSRDHRVYAIDDLTEPGKSQMTRKVNKVEELANWYIEVFDKLRIHKFILVGASKGGWLAVYLALSLGDRVEKLILLSPLQTFSRVTPGAKLMSAVRYALNPNRQHLKDVLSSMSANVSRINILFIDQFHLGAKISNPSALVSKFSPFSRKDLERLKMPVLVLIGDQDIINNKSVIEKANEYIPRAETWIIPNAGHFLSMDQTEITNGRIRDFLNSQRLTSY